MLQRMRSDTINVSYIAQGFFAKYHISHQIHCCSSSAATKPITSNSVESARNEETCLRADSAEVVLIMLCNRRIYHRHLTMAFLLILVKNKKTTCELFPAHYLLTCSTSN